MKSFAILRQVQQIYICLYVTCWPPIASGRLPGRLLWEEERGEGAGLCAEAAELSPVHEGERLEPDPVDPGEVAGAPVS